jgi:hypothetical protein
MTQPAPSLPFLPLDLQHFLNAVLLAAEMEGGFGLGDVARVEEAWEIADAVIVSHGYVVALAGGQRVYLEYTMDDSAGETDEEIAIEPLPPGMERPDLSEGGGGGGGVYWYRPDHIAEYLAAQRTGPAARH